MYHVRVHSLAERVLSYIRRQEFLHAGDRVGVAVSGGIDSVALLRLLLEMRTELGIVVSVVHFNHKLRGSESDSDQEFVASLAREYDLEFHTDSDDVAAQAAEEHVSVEAAAREMRYGFFCYLLGEDRALTPQGLKPSSMDAGDGGAGSCAPSKPDHASLGHVARAVLDKVATGHTLDDQAETVLMRIIRGSGLRGLRGIFPRIPVEDDGQVVSGEIIRPLLAIRRRDLERYLKDLNQPWRDDGTNASTKFTRNRLRQLVLPLLERDFNPAVAENLAELAEIARGEEDFWENEAAGWRGTTVQWTRPAWSQGFYSSFTDSPLVQIQPHDPAVLRRVNELGPLVMDASVSRAWLLAEPLAVQRRVVKAIGEHAGIPLEFQHVEEILRFAAENGPSGKELSLPLGWKVRSEPEAVMFLTPDLRTHERIPQDYEYELSLPGTVAVPEAGSVIEAVRITMEPLSEGYSPQHLLDAAQLHGPLKVRNWRPGDRFWPAHTKSPKKIKQLLQDRHVAQAVRKSWPVITNGEDIVWLRGFPVPAKLQPKAGREAILIQEMPRSSVVENLES
jgi:tRNA(Ile)-lysidine synthase